jgi:hypothetical protein
VFDDLRAGELVYLFSEMLDESFLSSLLFLPLDLGGFRR